MLVMVLLSIILPLSLFFWTVHTLFRMYNGQNELSEPIPLFRWLMSLLVPLMVSSYGLKKKSLSTSGAIAGLFVGFILTLSNYCFLASLFTFFISGSLATKFRSKMKRLLDDEFKENGERNWIQVLCNGGIASQIALIYMLEAGCGELPVDFQKRYSISWMSMAILGQLACSCGDTLASEIGSVTGSSNPISIVTFSRVPRGTNGGFSLIGIISSIFGGFLVGLSYYCVLLSAGGNGYHGVAPPQWPIVLIGALAGFIGSTLDSYLGATLQYSGYDEKKMRIVSAPGPSVEYISGRAILDNHSVNLLSALITSLLTPPLAFLVWKWTT